MYGKSCIKEKNLQKNSIRKNNFATFFLILLACNFTLSIRGEIIFTRCKLIPQCLPWKFRRQICFRIAKISGVGNYTLFPLERVWSECTVLARLHCGAQRNEVHFSALAETL